MLDNVMPCTSVLYSEFKLSAYSWSGSKQHYMNLDVSIFTYLVLKILVFFPTAVKTGAYHKMLQHAPPFAFMNMPINAVLKKYIPIPTPIFKYTHFKLLWALIIFSLFSDCHKLAYVS